MRVSFYLVHDVSPRLGYPVPDLINAILYRPLRVASKFFKHVTQFLAISSSLPVSPQCLIKSLKREKDLPPLIVSSATPSPSPMVSAIPPTTSPAAAFSAVTSIIAFFAVPFRTLTKDLNDSSFVDTWISEIGAL